MYVVDYVQISAFCAAGAVRRNRAPKARRPGEDVAGHAQERGDLGNGVAQHEHCLLCFGQR
eukprot:12293043-Alexandrium_andersonii.AAC.1